MRGIYLFLHGVDADYFHFCLDRYIAVLESPALIIKGIGICLSKINGMGKLESFNAVSSMIVGQSENFIAIKNLVPHMTDKQMYTLSATAMSTVSMSIVGSYMQLIEPRFVVTALILNMFSTFVVLNIINPYEVDSSTTDQLMTADKRVVARSVSSRCWGNISLPVLPLPS